MTLYTTVDLFVESMTQAWFVLDGMVEVVSDSAFGDVSRDELLDMVEAAAGEIACELELFERARVRFDARRRAVLNAALDRVGDDEPDALWDIREMHAVLNVAVASSGEAIEAMQSVVTTMTRMFDRGEIC